MQKQVTEFTQELEQWRTQNKNLFNELQKNKLELSNVQNELQSLKDHKDNYYSNTTEDESTKISIEKLEN